MARKGNTVLVMLGLGFAFAAAAAGGGGNGGGNGGGGRSPNAPVAIPDTEEEAREIAATLCVCAGELNNAGVELTPATLRLCLVDRWWPTATFPPIPADPKSISDAWLVATALVASYLADPQLFSDQFCPQEGDPGDEPEPGDVVHTGEINVSAVCAPPLPQSVPIRVLYAGPSTVTAQAYSPMDDSWMPIALEGDDATQFDSISDAITATRSIVLEVAAQVCAGEEGAIIGELEIGDVVHTGAINIAAVCAPPLPQEVPIRILFAGNPGVSAQAWDFIESEWQDIRDELGELRYFASPAEAIDATRAIVLGFAGTFCSTTIPAEPAEPAEPAAPATIDLGGLPVDFERVPIPPIEQYPWEAALIHEGENGQHWPTPGMFFLVRDDAAPTDPILALDSMLGIARVALSSAYAMAGAARQLADIPAEQVLAYLSLIVCSPWNDVAYGATSADVVGGELGLGPHARGVNMLARHHNNIGELMVGNSPRRTTTLAGGVDGSAEGTNTHWPQLWLPPIRLEMLRDLGVVSTAGDSWSNGDSVIVPPPVVWDHPVYTTVSPPGGSWGC